MKNIDKDEEFVSLSYEELDKLRKELFQRLSKEKRESLGGICTLSQKDPATFNRLWIQPLLTAGLDFETIAHLVDSYLWPN
jgi:hypothetical protein